MAATTVSIFSVPAGHVQKEGYGEDQPQVHRHFQQVRPWTLPDLRREKELLGSSQEGCPERGCLNVKGQKIKICGQMSHVFIFFKLEDYSFWKKSF